MRMEFKSAVTQRQEEKTTVEINIEGGKFKANDEHVYVLEKPDTALFSIVMGSAATAATDADRAAAIWDYFRGTLSRADFLHLRDRVIVDRDVDMDLLMEIVEGTVEVFANFPTQPSAGSSPSQTPTGPQLMGRAPGAGSTSSDFPLLGS